MRMTAPQRACTCEAEAPGVDFLLLAFPRSGSSALRHQLNRLAEIHIPPESSFAVWVADRLSDAWPEVDAERLISDILAARKFEHWLLSAEDIRACVGACPASVQSAITAIYRRHRDRFRPGAALIGDKNNSYIFAPDRALEVLSPRSVVLLWRDPAQIWDSLQRLEFLRPRLSPHQQRYFPSGWDDPDALVEAWVAAHEAVLALVGRGVVSPAELHVVAHRDFVADSVGTIDLLASRLLGSSGRREVVPEALREPAAFALWKRGVEDEHFQSRAMVRPLENLVRDPDAVQVARSMMDRLSSLSHAALNW